MTLKRVILYVLLPAVCLVWLLPDGGRASRPLPPEGWIGIYERADLEQISQLPDGQYILMNDIDLTGEPWIGLCSEDVPFTGTLDGNGHTVYGMTTAANASPVGLFVSIWGGTVQNLTVAGTASGSVVGLLCGKLCDGTILSCRAQGTVESYFCGGGLVGQISGQGVLLSDCTADVAVGLKAPPAEDPPLDGDSSDSTDSATDVPSQDMTTDNTSSEESVTDVSSDSSGEASSDTLTENTDSSPTPVEVEAEGFLGGLVGAVYGSEIQILSCETAGSLTADLGILSVGGITGVLDGTATVSRCGTEAVLALTPSSVAYVGGMVGRMGQKSVSLQACSFRGDWTIPSCGGIVDLGGIVGSISADEAVTVEDCVAFGTLSSFASSSHVGGIVGSSVAAQGTVTVARSSSFVTLSGEGDPLAMGGICGINRGDGGRAEIVNCHADGKLLHTEAPIRDPSLFFGGICGLNGGEGISLISHCFSSCDLSVFYPIADGAVVGMSFPFTDTAEARVTQCYYRDGVREYYATPVSGSALSDPASYEGFDFEKIWLLDQSTGMPLLRREEMTDLVLPVGDVDGNGRLTAYDARLLLQYLTGRVTFTDGQQLRADMNGDGKLDARDASLILRNAT